MLLLPIFHLVILTQPYFVKSKEPSPNSYAYSSKQVGENFILQLYSPFHFPTSKTRLKICTGVFPQLFKIKISLTTGQNQAFQFKLIGQANRANTSFCVLTSKEGNRCLVQLTQHKQWPCWMLSPSITFLAEKDTGKGNASPSLVSPFDKIKGRERAENPFSSQHQSPALGASGIESSLKLKSASTKQIVRGKPKQRHLLLSTHLLEPSRTYKSNSAGTIAACKF